ncbi:glutamine amidotransferase [Paenibacillus sp. TRM 82003]|uniref:glutamine amidotransferase n=1 Tax=Kineococcus sp. TRM81007 TaxID=2925831 RepID=UPI001F57003C|nr:glutamine amidotransferase [Kineococcus sp. TRM81007]MCI2238738.1 glutamine amidotransferase [Kineococcus sp. TRM81007]MCI3924145.1 glutamine amidotransferase [Paenibacillus sp. TRM 82003]
MSAVRRGKPFLLLATREHDGVADAEHAAVLRHGGLRPGELVRVRLERGPMPEVDLDDFSGVVVGGSPFCTSDPEGSKSDVQRRVERELATLLDRVVAADAPFLGACYGIGTLGVHRGGVVDRTYGEPIGTAPVTLTAAGRADPVLGALPDTFEAFVGHKEALRVPPPHAVVLATSPACPVQAFRVGENLYATQFHPELDVDGIVQRVGAYRDSGYFPPHEHDEVVARLRRSRVQVASRVLRRFVERYRRS